MPKATDLRLSRAQFEDAVRRILAVPPLPEKTAKKADKKAAKKLRRN
jgi:hypothetical protein